MNKKQLNNAIQNDLYISVTTIPLSKNGIKTPVKELIDILKKISNNLNLFKLNGTRYQTKIDFKKPLNAEVILPFSSNEELNDFIKNKETISISDLEIILNPSQKDLASLESHENHGDLFSSQTEDLQRNIQENLQEKRDIAHKIYVDSMKSATAIVSDLSGHQLTAHQLQDKLDMVKDPDLVRKLIAAQGKQNFSLNLDDQNSLEFGGNNQIPTSLVMKEWSLKSCRVTEFTSGSSCKILVASENSEFLSKNPDIKSHLLSINFIKGRDEHTLLKYCEASRIKFDLDIQVNQAIADKRKSYSLLQVHSHSLLIQKVTEYLDRLIARQSRH